MKNIKVFIFIGLFIVTTSVLCFTGKKSIYEKKNYFKTPEEIINILNTKTLSAFLEKNNIYSDLVATDDLMECLSKRKRITNPNMNFFTLDLEINNDADKDEIKKDYINKLDNLQDYNIPSKIEAYSFTGRYTAPYNNSGTLDINIVFIDEGEGYVIDYIKYRMNSSNNYIIE